MKTKKQIIAEFKKRMRLRGASLVAENPDAFAEHEYWIRALEWVLE